MVKKRDVIFEWPLITRRHQADLYSLFTLPTRTRQKDSLLVSVSAV